MKDLGNLTPNEVFDVISKRLRIKLEISDTTHYRRKVNRYNTLTRIIEFLNNHTFTSNYSNKNIEIHNSGNHYWIDLWVKDDLATIEFDKNDNV